MNIALQIDAVSAAAITTMVETVTDTVNNIDHSNDNSEITANAKFNDASAPASNKAGKSRLASNDAISTEQLNDKIDKSQNIDDENIQFSLSPEDTRLEIFQDDNLKKTNGETAHKSFSFDSEHANQSGNTEEFYGSSGSFKSPEDSSQSPNKNNTQYNDDSFDFSQHLDEDDAKVNLFIILVRLIDFIQPLNF